MSKDSDEKIDAGTPALFVLCGATRKKWRPLQGDVVMLGRSSGCDIGLVSPEVAPVHCVIVRTLSGWRIRDCSGRAFCTVNIMLAATYSPTFRDAVPSAQVSLTSLFGMGRGGTSPLKPPTIRSQNPFEPPFGGQEGWLFFLH